MTIKKYQVAQQHYNHKGGWLGNNYMETTNSLLEVNKFIENKYEVPCKERIPKSSSMGNNLILV
jgi:hypothetical protein